MRRRSWLSGAAIQAVRDTARENIAAIVLPLR
jgi:hypothetical protein